MDVRGPEAAAGRRQARDLRGGGPLSAYTSAEGGAPESLGPIRLGSGRAYGCCRRMMSAIIGRGSRVVLRGSPLISE